MGVERSNFVEREAVKWLILCIYCNYRVKNTARKKKLGYIVLKPLFKQFLKTNAGHSGNLEAGGWIHMSYFYIITKFINYILTIITKKQQTKQISFVKN